jgi:serine/threonine-protein kinase
MKDSQFLDIARATPTPWTEMSVTDLPADILKDASKRLGWASLFYAVTFFLAYFGIYFFARAMGAEDYAQPGLAERWVQSLVAFLSITLALVVFGLSRYAKVRPNLMLDLGLIFEVVGAFGISMAQFWGLFSEWSESSLGEFGGIPWECVWILIFPLLAPNTPGKTFLASICAASTGLLTILLSKASGATSPEVPLLLFAGYFLFTTYLCAGIAFLISRSVYKLGGRLKKAHEIGSYQLIEPLGEGGMGQVWRAKHRLLVRPAAVKLIRPEKLGLDQGSRRAVLRRFEREAQATAGLGSPHTVELYDFGIAEGGSFYYVMELLEGLSLDALIKRFGPIPPSRTIHLLRQVCHSLRDAHEHGLLHRDIKPANIFSCHIGPDYDFIKVLDFGLVKWESPTTDEETHLTAEGVATGTPAFMAPEMATGKGQVDGRVDIYGLGCVGYWLLTGMLVFEAKTALEMVVQHVQTDPVPPSHRTEMEIPKPLEQIILSCLAKEPGERPASAEALSDLLASCETRDGWNQALAKNWWKVHMPESQVVKRKTVSS